MDRKQKDLFIIYLISFLDLTTIGIIFPIFGSHLKELGISYTAIGFVNSVYSAIQVFSAPVIGSWSDLVDRRTVMSYNLIICSVCYLVLGTTSSLYVIVFLRVVLGITKQTQTIIKAMTADIISQKERMGTYGYMTGLGSLGFMLGPMIGGYIGGLPNGFFYVSAITSFIFFINFLLVNMLGDNYRHLGKERKAKTTLQSEVYKKFDNFWKSLRQLNLGNLWFDFLIRFLFGCAVNLYFSQQEMYLNEEFHLDHKNRGYIISYFSAVGVIISFWMKRINDYFYKDDVNYSKRLKHFFALNIIAVFGIIWTDSFNSFMIFLTLFSVSTTVLRIVTMETLLREELYKGSLSGFSNSIMAVSRFISPITTGIIRDNYGTKSPLLAALVPAVLGYCLIMFKNK